MGCQKGDRMMNGKIHLVRRKRDTSFILFWLFYIIYHSHFLIKTFRYDKLYSYFLFAFGVCIIGFFIYVLFRFLRYSISYYPLRFVELELLPGSLRLGECVIEVSDMDAILIDGYWNPTTAIKLKGKKRVPLHLRMKYNHAKQEEEVLKELRSWAKIHQIPISYKRIVYS